MQAPGEDRPRRKDVPAWARDVRFPRPSNRVPFVLPGSDFLSELEVTGYSTCHEDRAGWICMTCEYRFLGAVEQFLLHIDQHRAADQTPLVAHWCSQHGLEIPSGWLTVVGWPIVEAYALPECPALTVEVIAYDAQDAIVTPLVGGGLARVPTAQLGSARTPGTSSLVRAFNKVMRDQEWPDTRDPRLDAGTPPDTTEDPQRELVAAYGHGMRSVVWKTRRSPTRYTSLDGMEIGPHPDAIVVASPLERAIVRRLLANGNLETHDVEDS
jgi:hypothetical protein